MSEIENMKTLNNLYYLHTCPNMLYSNIEDFYVHIDKSKVEDGYKYHKRIVKFNKKRK